MNKKEVRNLVVIENTALNATNFLIRLTATDPLPTLLPGQFVNIEIKDSSEIFLRRPFSVFDVDYTQNTISIIL